MANNQVMWYVKPFISCIYNIFVDHEEYTHEMLAES